MTADAVDDHSLAWHPVRQDLPRRALAESRETLRRGLDERLRRARILPGARVAVAVGSRGIPGIGGFVAEVGEALRSAGLAPFVVPAMGTHGGAAPSEQRAVLAHLGVTEPSVGMPVVSQGALVLAGTTPGGIPVWVDAAAWAAEAVVPVNRVKPHTAFRGTVESGPSKLLAVGLGKERSAAALHRAGLAQGIPEATSLLLATGRVPLGVALVEDPFGNPARMEVLEPATWFEAEAACLEDAWELYPRLPWDDLDLLVVERMGKDLSGTGMDLNVIGLERRFPGCGALPRIGVVAVLGLTEGSRGNATGIGYADVVARTAAEAVDWEVTRANCRATGFAEAARCPMVADDEADTLRRCLELLPGRGPDELRAVRVRDTLHLDRFHVSTALLRSLPTTVHRGWG